MRDLGARVVWPASPVGFDRFAGELKRIHAIWRAKKIINSLPEVLKESLPEKVAAYEALEGKRPEWGYSRSWKGDYLNLVSADLFLKAHGSQCYLI